MALTMMDLPVGNSGHPHPLMHMVCLHLFRHNDCTKACKQMNLSESLKSMSERDRTLMDNLFHHGLMIGHQNSSSEIDPNYMELCKAQYSSYETIVSKVYAEIAAYRNYFEKKSLEPLVNLLRCIYRRFTHLGPLMYSSYTAAAELALENMTHESLAEWCQTFKTRRLYLDGSDSPASRDMLLIVKSRLGTPASALQMILEDMQADKKYDDYMVPDKATAASIIGRLGERVMKLRTDYNCYIESPPADTPEDGPRHFRITGPKENRDKVIRAMNDIVQRHRSSPSNGNGGGGGSVGSGQGFSGAVGVSSANSNDVRALTQGGRSAGFRERLPNSGGSGEQFVVILDEKFWVRRSQCGLVIGTNGATVRAIQELTHTVIQSPEKPREPPSLEEMACFRVTYRVPKELSADASSPIVRDAARGSVNRAITYMIIYIQHTNQHSNTDVTALVDDHYTLIEGMSDEEKERLYEEVHIAQTALGQRDSVTGGELRPTRSSRQTQQSASQAQAQPIQSSQPPSLLQQQHNNLHFTDYRSSLQRQKQRQLMLHQHQQHSSGHTGSSSSSVVQTQPESLMHCDFTLPEMPMSPARSVGCLESRGGSSGRCMSGGLSETWSLISSDRMSSSYRAYDHVYRDHGSDHHSSNIRQRCASGNVVFGSSHPSSSSHSGFNHVSGFSGNGSINHCSSSSRLISTTGTSGATSAGVLDQTSVYGAHLPTQSTQAAQSDGDILIHAPTQSRFFSLGTSHSNGLYKSDGADYDSGVSLEQTAFDAANYKWNRSDNSFLSQTHSTSMHSRAMPVNSLQSVRQDSRWMNNYRLNGLNSSHHMGHDGLQMGGVMERPGELRLQAADACSNNPLGDLQSDMPSPSVLCPLMKDLSTEDHFGPPVNGYSSANGPWAFSAIGSERKQSLSENSDSNDYKFSVMAMSTSTEGSSRKENSPDRELEMQDFTTQFREKPVVDEVKEGEPKKMTHSKNGVVCPH